jgi:hypothetical protein
MRDSPLEYFSYKNLKEHSLFDAGSPRKRYRYDNIADAVVLKTDGCIQLISVDKSFLNSREVMSYQVSKSAAWRGLSRFYPRLQVLFSSFDCNLVMSMLS